jgi:hypothetical protein
VSENEDFQRFLYRSKYRFDAPFTSPSSQKIIAKKDPGPSIGGEVPRHFFWSLLRMKELSIFVDESGDFGEYDYHSPYYIITMVFHNQENDIAHHIHKFNTELELLGFDPHHCVHNGPIIRREPPYENMDIIPPNMTIC